MRVLVAGATGVVGRPTVAALARAGHTVLAIARKPTAIALLRKQGVATEAADALDRASLDAAFAKLRPEAVVHQLTAIPAVIRPKHLDLDMAATNRLRTLGTHNLVAAGRAVGARRFVAQSIAFVARPGDGLASEADGLYLDAPKPGGFYAMVEAVAALERQTLHVGGVALRYGMFYGPGTVWDDDGSMTKMLRKRRMPIIGAGGGMFSFIHVADAAAAAVRAVESDLSGVYHIVDDRPATSAEVMTEVATILGAPRPMRVPRMVAQLVAGRYGVFMMCEARGADNAKAKRELGWAPRIADWKQGMRDFRTRMPDGGI